MSKRLLVEYRCDQAGCDKTVIVDLNRGWGINPPPTLDRWLISGSAPVRHFCPDHARVEPKVVRK